MLMRVTSHACSAGSGSDALVNDRPSSGKLLIFCMAGESAALCHVGHVTACYLFVHLPRDATMLSACLDHSMDHTVLVLSNLQAASFGLYSQCEKHQALPNRNVVEQRVRVRTMMKRTTGGRKVPLLTSPSNPKRYAPLCFVLYCYGRQHEIHDNGLLP